MLKTFLLTICILVNISNMFAQGPTGLIAHWDMTSGADVSGNGHTGHLYNVTSVAGKDGNPNTAYYFNGIDSKITAGYLPDLNTTQLSICATVKVMGFYAGSCQDNVIIVRSNPSTSVCSFVLDFADGHFPTGSSCTVLDSTTEVFNMLCQNNMAATDADLQYTPTIKSFKWYKIVTTFDGTTFKIHVNDTLVNTYTSAGYPVTPNTDSICIGYDIFGSTSTFPYPFKGIIDDIMLYNRVLADSEITQYSGDTCGTITSQPTAKSVITGKNTTYTVSTSIGSPSYQWQQDAGTGFVNLTNSGPYSGVTTPTLTITGVTNTMNNYHYRCLISGISSCSATSSSAALTVLPNLVGNIVTNDMISIYPNPTRNFITIRFPVSTEYQGNVQVIDELGRTLISHEIQSDILSLDLNTLATGIYQARIQLNGETFYKKISKD